MERRFKITVEGQAYDVLVEEITEDAGDLYPDRGTMRAAVPEASRSAGGVAVSAKAAAKPARQAGPGDVVSPLSGIVLSIDVEPGAAVEADSQVATLEAMKTKTIVTAGRAGNVGKIAVSVREAVEVDQILLTIV